MAFSWRKIIIFGIFASLVACSQPHQEPATTTTFSASSESSYSYPHPTLWSAQHVEFYAKNGAKLRGTKQDCAVCHNGSQLSGAPKNISCGAQCHTPKSNPDGAPIPPRIPTTDEGKACLACHRDVAHKAKVHYPTAAGLCSTCHTASPEHASKMTSDTVTTNRKAENCYGCHFAKDKEPVVHMALKMGDESCLMCHDPHGSEQRFFAKDKLDSMCVMCHQTIPEHYKSMHGIIDSKKSEKSCTNCHSPHSSKNEKLLLVPKKELCATCHNKDIQTTFANGKTRIIPNIKKKIEESTNPHPGAYKNRDNCTKCHLPHTSDNPFLLNKNYPESSTAKYDPGSDSRPNTYEACFRCHDESMLEKEIDEDSTAFRNDEKLPNGKIKRKNLHWFHVVDAAGSVNKEAGKTCYVCHDPHGSNQEHSIKEAWKTQNGTEVKVEYTATPTGGQCTKTCHDLRSYKREE